MFEELEYKYKAESISLESFQKLMATLPVQNRVVASSWDIYFVHQNDADSMQRLRFGAKPELTKKVKTQSNNNWKRVEVDVPLDPARLTEETVAKYVGLDGYQENFRIFKACDIFFLEDVNYVYYVVYDRNLKEIGRFIEVEVNKESVQALDAISQNHALTRLKEAEAPLEQLGISPQNRLKKSLFEIYRRTTS